MWTADCKTGGVDANTACMCVATSNTIWSWLKARICMHSIGFYGCSWLLIVGIKLLAVILAVYSQSLMALYAFALSIVIVCREWCDLGQIWHILSYAHVFFGGVQDLDRDPLVLDHRLSVCLVVVVGALYAHMYASCGWYSIQSIDSRIDHLLHFPVGYVDALPLAPHSVSRAPMHSDNFRADFNWISHAVGVPFSPSMHH